MKKIILFFCLMFLASCDNFEKRFFREIAKAKASALENGYAFFDISAITNFEWDSVFLVRGNESVTVMDWEISEQLNQRKSYLHWEDMRFGGKIDTTFRWETKDLHTDRDRFYFLTPDKNLIAKEIRHKHGIFRIHYCCDRHTSKDRWWNYDFWLSKQEANFLVFSKEVTTTYESSKNDTVTTYIRVWFEQNCINDR
jgi:hypothetical protein